jgi:uncharacterized protein YndB with AHSA1/START domain
MKDGVLEQIDGAWQLRFERRLAHDPARVWRALTRPEELAAWFPTTIEGSLRPGSPLRFNFADQPLEGFDGEVIAADENRLLEFVWGEDRLRISLAPEDGGTRLTLIDVLDDRGKGARDGAGWHVCLDNLEALLDDTAPPASDAWKSLNESYQERFGPEASTIGPPEGVVTA